MKCCAQESWLAAQFNCISSQTFDVSSASNPPALGDQGEKLFLESPADEVFHSSDEELQTANGGAQPSDESEEIFWSSDEGDYVRPPPVKRGRYAARSSQGSEFLNKSVCKEALARLVGVGNSTISKIRRGEMAFTNHSRPELPKRPMFGFTMRGETSALWEHIIMFLWFVYQSCAEFMPNYFRMAGEQSAETAFPEDKEDVDHDCIARLVNGFSQTLQTVSTDIDVNQIGPGTFRGPMKALPHGTRAELYWEYKVFSESRGLPVASYSTFMRVANPILKPDTRNTGHLRFRKTGEHAQCDQCFSLRKAIAKAKNPAEKLSLQKDHHRHVLSSWLCRHVYWSMRALSQATFAAVIQDNARHAWDALAVSSCVVCAMVDGMDQAKFKVPRTKARHSKLYSRLWRPQLHMAAVWMHGAMLNFFVSNEDCKKNSSTQCEMLMRSLDMILDRFEALPAGLAIQMDNTPREGKNQFFTGWIALLVALGSFRWATASFLLVGHSDLVLRIIFAGPGI